MAELVVRLPRMVSLSPTALARADWIEHHVVGKRRRQNPLSGRAWEDGWTIKTACGRFLTADFAQEVSGAAPPHKILLCTRCEKAPSFRIGARGFEILLYVDHGPIETPTLDGTAIESWRQRYLDRPGRLVGSMIRTLTEEDAR